MRPLLAVALVLTNTACGHLPSRALAPVTFRPANDTTGGTVGVLADSASGKTVAVISRATESPRRPLPPAERADVRVRFHDRKTGRYLNVCHSVRFPGDIRQSCYHSGTEADGWGKSFWLPPGRYAIDLDELPCGQENFFPKRPIVLEFEARAGVPIDLTVDLDVLEVALRKSYNNPGGRKCAIAPK